ncbi:polysaccharide biosynthesis/export family protein [Pelagerythrobacter sp.]|uniref:polysaccharide biosynthesis/export family protein n=1 Tax=Pelagerythrobacter sp. TaxID=2800702 RepID=UPI0035ADC8BD
MHVKNLIMVALLVLLGACSTLPSSGPTGSRIKDTAASADLDIEIVEVDSVAAVPPRLAPVAWNLPDREPPPTDMIGPGDVLTINVFEAGVSLFGGNGASGNLTDSGFDPSVRMSALPPVRVNDEGDINIPYAGRIRVLGNTVGEVQEKIRVALRFLSQDPQVTVNREEVVSSSVIVGGEVVRPGRLVLQTNRETIGDVIALSGGYRGAAKDLVLRIERGSDEANIRLSSILAGDYENAVAYPGDRLTVLADPHTFSVLGASGRVQQMPFARDTMTVVEAISAAGGPNAGSGDPEAVFLFRYLGPGNTRPVVYHFNMMNTATYFLAQQFALRDGDILYFGNAAANQPRALIQAISQLFAPVVTATAVAENFGN